MSLADWRLDPPDDPHPEEMVTDHDLYMESVMDDEPDDGHPHDWEHLIEGDRVYGEVCTHCDVKHLWRRTA